MAQPSKWERSAEYWKMLPPTTNLIFLAGIFFLFTSFGLVASFINRDWVHITFTFITAFVTGVFSAAWAFAGFRRVIWLMVVLLPLEIGTFVLIGHFSKGHLVPFEQADFSRDVVAHRLMLEGYFGMLSILIAYALVISFVRKEGIRIFGAMAEVRLAAEVHQALVPAVAQRVGEFEFCGVSVPSGQVGGDLVDLMQQGHDWTAYVADVSGHGVPAGMVMAMVKSAARMGSGSGENLSALMVDLNRVLLAVSAPNVFVTFACISGSNGSALRFVLAGHLPVLHYSKRLRTVEERSVSNLPIGILSDAKFESASIDCEEGDLLAVLTDGLTEAADSKGEELGLEPLKAILLKSAGNPLEQIVNDLRSRSLAQGKQVDDQTVLLVRRVAA
jgi:serine phosphatase RsbU (regulator of sigma subunit)